MLVPESCPQPPGRDDVIETPGAATSGFSRRETGAGPTDEKSARTPGGPSPPRGVTAPTVIAPADVPGETIEVGGVKLIGARNLPGRIAPATTVLYAKNLLNFVQLLVDPKGQELKIDTNDELIKGTLITKDGKVVHPALLQSQAA